MEKRRIAVMFGGRSPEHDISIITGLQVLQAIDSDRYDAFPVYVTTEGDWLVGEELAERRNYLPDAALRKRLTPVSLMPRGSAGGRLVAQSTGLFSKPRKIDFDVVIPAFHGIFGEDGNMQGALETANIPYTGMRTMGSAVLMDKAATKRALQGTGVPTLPQVEIQRPRSGFIIPPDKLAAMVGEAPFPAIVKPNHLGSSIGVAKVKDIKQLAGVLPGILKLDTVAILEPFVENLTEYNISVARFGDAIKTSAIERPRSTSELLDFKEKYLSGGGKAGAKTPEAPSQGMASLTRDINPDLPAEMERNIRSWAATAFGLFCACGAPRIDFLCNGQTGQLWLNEINPCPGSFAFMLWEAAAEPLVFTELLSCLIEQAIDEHQRGRLPPDPVPVEARLFKNRGTLGG